MHEMSSEPEIAFMAQAMLESCLCHHTRMATRVVTRAYDDALRPTGLRAGQLAVLAAIGARGAMSIKALADGLEMDRTTLTRNLRPLEARGYVALDAERRHRSRGLSLTPAGETALCEALPLWERVQASSRSRLGQERWSEVQGALRDLVGGFDL